MVPTCVGNDCYIICHAFGVCVCIVDAQSSFFVCRAFGRVGSRHSSLHSFDPSLPSLHIPTRYAPALEPHRNERGERSEPLCHIAVLVTDDSARDRRQAASAIDPRDEGGLVECNAATYRNHSGLCLVCVCVCLAFNMPPVVRRRNRPVGVVPVAAAAPAAGPVDPVTRAHHSLVIQFGFLIAALSSISVDFGVCALTRPDDPLAWCLLWPGVRQFASELRHLEGRVSAMMFRLVGRDQPAQSEATSRRTVHRR